MATTSLQFTKDAMSEKSTTLSIPFSTPNEPMAVIMVSFRCESPSYDSMALRLNLVNSEEIETKFRSRGPLSETKVKFVTLEKS